MMKKRVQALSKAKHLKELLSNRRNEVKESPDQDYKKLLVEAVNLYNIEKEFSNKMKEEKKGHVIYKRLAMELIQHHILYFSNQLMKRLLQKTESSSTSSKSDDDGYEDDKRKYVKAIVNLMGFTQQDIDKFSTVDMLKYLHENVIKANSKMKDIMETDLNPK